MTMLRKSKLLSVLLILTFIIGTMQISVFAAFESAAGSAILMEASTGQILYEKNADAAVPPASITKLMTLLLGFEAVENGKATWDDMVPVSEKAWKTEGSIMFLEVGRKVKYSELITGISVVSANDGCVALAEYLSGSEAAFVDVMNKRARELGLTSASFKNSMGLNVEGHVISAKDIASLARYLIQKFPKILEIESMKEFTYNNIWQPNRNPLLGSFPGADGLKTGWTDEAGYCLVGTAVQNGTRLISVVLNTKNEAARDIASRELLNYGFKNFSLYKAKSMGDIVDNIAVIDGKKPEVPIKVDSDISFYIHSDRKNDIKLEIEKTGTSLNAPITAGTPAGKLLVKLDDKVLAAADISIAENVAKLSFFEKLFRSLGNFFMNLF